MKRQILFSGENRKNIINLLSAELAQRVVKSNVNLPSYRRLLDVQELLHCCSTQPSVYRQL